MADRVPWHQELTYRTGVNDTFSVADSDIVTRLRDEAIKETDDGICYSCGGNFQTVTHYSGCVVLTVSEAADEIERLREKNEWLDSHVGALVIGFRENKAEIERLKRSIKFSAGIISTYTNQHPEEVLNYLKEEGRRNG